MLLKLSSYFALPRIYHSVFIASLLVFLLSVVADVKRSSVDKNDTTAKETCGPIAILVLSSRPQSTYV
jgi:hypothetical protein